MARRNPAPKAAVPFAALFLLAGFLWLYSPWAGDIADQLHDLLHGRGFSEVEVTPTATDPAE